MVISLLNAGRNPLKNLDSPKTSVHYPFLSIRDFFFLIWESASAWEAWEHLQNNVQLKQKMQTSSRTFQRFCYQLQTEHDFFPDLSPYVTQNFTLKSYTLFPTFQNILNCCISYFCCMFTYFLSISNHVWTHILW